MKPNHPLSDYVLTAKKTVYLPHSRYESGSRVFEAIANEVKHGGYQTALLIGDIGDNGLTVAFDPVMHIANNSVDALLSEPLTSAGAFIGEDRFLWAMRIRYEEMPVSDIRLTDRPIDADFSGWHIAFDAEGKPQQIHRLTPLFGGNKYIAVKGNTYQETLRRIINDGADL